MLNRYACSAVMVRVSICVPRGGMRLDFGLRNGAHWIEMSGCRDELDGVGAGKRWCGHHQRQHHSRLHVGGVERRRVDRDHIGKQRAGRRRRRLSRLGKSRPVGAPRHRHGERRADRDLSRSCSLQIHPLADKRQHSGCRRHHDDSCRRACGLRMDRGEPGRLDSGDLRIARQRAGQSGDLGRRECRKRAKRIVDGCRPDRRRLPERARLRRDGESVHGERERARRPRIVDRCHRCGVSMDRDRVG